MFAPPVATNPDFHPPAAVAWQADRPETSKPVPFSVNQYLNFSVGPIVSGPLQLGTLRNLNYSFQKLLKGAVAVYSQPNNLLVVTSCGALDTPLK